MLPIFASGFYNQAFIWPSWHFWEGLIRQSAGIGTVPEVPDPQHYHKRHAHCDVLVVGAGPAGIMATLEAAQSGARVMLVDEQETFGGSLQWERDQIEGMDAAEWLQQTLATLNAFNNDPGQSLAATDLTTISW